jgi:sugar phosphate isomerase/epimerase
LFLERTIVVTYAGAGQWGNQMQPEIMRSGNKPEIARGAVPLIAEKASFGVSQFTHWFQTFEQDVLLYKRLGVDTVELCERKLANDPGQARAQLGFLKLLGLPVSSIQPRVHALFQDSMCADILEPAARIREFRNSIDLMSEFFPNAPMVTISGVAPHFNFKLAHQTARKLYVELADYAADHDMRIMYEPLHPILMNNNTFICTLKEAVMLIDAVQRDNFGLCLDLWHVWQEPLIEEQIQALGDRIFGVHISDWPPEQPRCLGDRRLPGEGCIPLSRLFHAIEKTGYKGAYSLEIFSEPTLPDSLWNQDPEEVIERGRRGFYDAWLNRTN